MAKTMVYHNVNCARIPNSRKRCKGFATLWLLELVTESPNCLDDIRLSTFTQFAPHIAYVDIDYVPEIVCVNIPHVFCDHPPSQHLTRMAHQYLKQYIFFARKS